jgi:hypothetical protein
MLDIKVDVTKDNFVQIFAVLIAGLAIGFTAGAALNYFIVNERNQVLVENKTTADRERDSAKSESEKVTKALLAATADKVKLEKSAASLQEQLTARAAQVDSGEAENRTLKGKVSELSGKVADLEKRVPSLRRSSTPKDLILDSIPRYDEKDNLYFSALTASLTGGNRFSVLAGLPREEFGKKLDRFACTLKISDISTRESQSVTFDALGDPEIVTFGERKVTLVLKQVVRDIGGNHGCVFKDATR